MPATTNSVAKRRAVIEYFENISGWQSLRDLDAYLDTGSVQAAKYYLAPLVSSGWLESTIINVVGADGVSRPTRHYRRARSIKKSEATHLRF